MKDFNCILCKYRKDPAICNQIMIDSQAGKYDWHCPTLSNIYYGKLIYYFPFNLIFKIQALLWEYKADKEYGFKKGGIN